MMKQKIRGAALCGLILVSLPMAHAQKFECTPVDLNAIWNAVIWYHDGQEVDPNLGLNTNGAGIKVSTLPGTVIPGQVNLTEDGVVVIDDLCPEGGSLGAQEVKEKGERLRRFIATIDAEASRH